jgi:rare lipoprotein A
MRPDFRSPRSSRPAHRTDSRRSVRVIAGLAVGTLGSATGLVAVLGVGAPAPSVASTSASTTALGAAPAGATAALPRPIQQRASRGAARTAPGTRTVVRTVAAGPTFRGQASWYGPGFQGRPTASGERYDAEGMTAASKTLPLGTRLRVCRASRCVVVRVNDRGPYVGDRVLDLSHAAAVQLGFDGVAVVTATPIKTVRVRVAVPAPARTPAPAPLVAFRAGFELPAPPAFPGR